MYKGLMNNRSFLTLLKDGKVFDNFCKEMYNECIIINMGAFVLVVEVLL